MPPSSSLELVLAVKPAAPSEVGFEVLKHPPLLALAGNFVHEITELVDHLNRQGTRGIETPITLKLEHLTSFHRDITVEPGSDPRSNSCRRSNVGDLCPKRLQALAHVIEHRLLAVRIRDGHDHGKGHALIGHCFTRAG